MNGRTKVTTSAYNVAALNDIANGLQMIERAVSQLGLTREQAPFARYARSLSKAVAARSTAALQRAHEEARSGREQMTISDWRTYETEHGD